MLMYAIPEVIFGSFARVKWEINRKWEPIFLSKREEYDSVATRFFLSKREECGLFCNKILAWVYHIFCKKRWLHENGRSLLIVVYFLS